MNRPGNERIGPVEARWQIRGDKGDQGDQGKRGEKGSPGPARLSPLVSRALVALFLIPSLIAITAAVGVVIQARNYQQATARSDARNARIRCQSIAQVVHIPVPVPVTDNPSREWVYRYSQIQRQRGEQLGCRLPPPRFVHVKGS